MLTWKTTTPSPLEDKSKLTFALIHQEAKEMIEWLEIFTSFLDLHYLCSLLKEWLKHFTEHIPSLEIEQISILIWDLYHIEQRIGWKDMNLYMLIKKMRFFLYWELLRRNKDKVSYVLWEG